MPISISPAEIAGGRIADPDAHFELFGVLAMAHAFVSDEAAKDHLPQYLEDSRTNMTNSSSLDLDEPAGCADGGEPRLKPRRVTFGGDVRSGRAYSIPALTIKGVTLPETMLTALEGKPLGRLLDGWMSHPGLIIDRIEADMGDVRIKVRPTFLSLEEAIAAIDDTAHQRTRRMAA